MFRLALALTLAVMLIPADKIPDRTNAVQSNAVQVGTFDTLSAAKSVYDDVRGFCQRNQEACATGDALLGQFKDKAYSGLQMIAVYVQDNDAATPDQTITGSLK